MYKIIAIYIILSFSFIAALADHPVLEDMDYYRFNTNYNGSAYNGASILVYGEAGVIVRSIDGGKSWDQINLNDSLNILLSITNIGTDYFGAAQNYLLKSIQIYILSMVVQKILCDFF
ncbi:MAG: hypothetical protein NT007_06020 [Candidatus Kapabacteria bacterium]|nr:hypothetical protein [Candidatus Kapabacteria bacterium]